jgi:hypothetical protein
VALSSRLAKSRRRKITDPREARREVRKIRADVMRAARQVAAEGEFAPGATMEAAKQVADELEAEFLAAVDVNRRHERQARQARRRAA